MKAPRIIDSCQWANRPSAEAFWGEMLHVVDIGGRAGSLWLSDGARWVPSNGRVLLGSSALALNAPDDLLENTLVSLTVPGGALGLKGTIEAIAAFQCTSSVNTKTLRFRFGGTAFSSISPTTSVGGCVILGCQNRDSAASQVGINASGNGGFGVTNGSLVTAAVNTAIDQPLLLNSLRGVSGAGETLTLERWQVSLIIPSA